MRLSDLLGIRAHDADGHRLGTVVDARFRVTDGPETLTLEGVLVSPHSGGSFLGYERSTVTSPALIARYLRWRHRGAFLVLWRDVRRLDERRIELREGYTKYSAVR
ncbi:PRC-barrel domain containing protein [Rhodococcus chondri]|uniref:PRC-barrel domain containing protein n=1 Tax=Rhodococcus chondri TaxID=3065941 RepID=A0ABU7JWT8_9NOCA|nr:PRC-barrel domain containing protein [Rhodococcus sp. CC-R104]MEE2034490.1 PRC-barrel domain containing protein [Rhodococcus sp. CC-R104]